LDRVAEWSGVNNGSKPENKTAANAGELPRLPEEKFMTNTNNPSNCKAIWIISKELIPNTATWKICVTSRTPERG